MQRRVVRVVSLGEGCLEGRGGLETQVLLQLCKIIYESIDNHFP